MPLSKHPIVPLPTWAAFVLLSCTEASQGVALTSRQNFLKYTPDLLILLRLSTAPSFPQPKVLTVYQAHLHLACRPSPAGPSPPALHLASSHSVLKSSSDVARMGLVPFPWACLYLSSVIIVLSAKTLRRTWQSSIAKFIRSKFITAARENSSLTEFPQHLTMKKSGRGTWKVPGSGLRDFKVGL